MLPRLASSWPTSLCGLLSGCWPLTGHLSSNLPSSLISGKGTEWTQLGEVSKSQTGRPLVAAGAGPSPGSSLGLASHRTRPNRTLGSSPAQVCPSPADEEAAPEPPPPPPDPRAPRRPCWAFEAQGLTSSTQASRSLGHHWRPPLATLISLAALSPPSAGPRVGIRPWRSRLWGW